MRRLAPGLALLLAACGNPQPLHIDSTPTASAPPSVATPPPPTATASAAPPADAGSPPPAAAAPDAGDADAGAAAAPYAADNKVEPTEGPELQERARALLDAIAKDDPALADSFWFPREPFTPLKDVKEPDKYWQQLHRTYGTDIHVLHKKRKSWDGATLVRFDGWSKPKWVKPGDEANKIGYYRAFHGKLRYKVGDEEDEIDVHTIITWQGRWYCTHLRKFKK
jgi:hypothetical protein